jgi:hypothetical protein
MKPIPLLPLCTVLVIVPLLAGCAGTNTIRTSQDTAIVQASAAPICGGIGSAKVAQKQAAIETLKAGYDRYVILGAASTNNVRATQLPGSYRTTGTLQGGALNATTVYQPGPTMVSGTHDQSFAIRMFRDGEPGSGQALSAREMLGPEWPELVKAGAVRTCT